VRAPASIVGLPACSLPAGVTPAGLHIGMQVIGAYGKDAELLGQLVLQPQLG